MLSAIKEFFTRIFLNLPQNLRKFLLRCNTAYRDYSNEDSGKTSRENSLHRMFFIELGHLDDYFYINSAVNLKVHKMTITLSGRAVKRFGVMGKDSEGNYVAVQGPIKFLSLDATVAEVTAAPDGLSVFISSTGKVGTSVVTATDTATGVTSSMIVEVVSGVLSSLEFVELPLGEAGSTDVDLSSIIVPAPIDAAITTEQPIS